MGGIGSGRTAGLHNTWGYQKLTLRGATKKFAILGRRFRLGPKYPDSYVKCGVGTFEIEWTPCHFGGHRVWFTCQGCRGRVGTLYAPNGSIDGSGRGDWRCRHCHRIEYDSQYDSEDLRAIARAWRAAGRAAAELDIDSVFLPPEKIPRPRYMRRDKFARLVAEYADAQQQMNATLNAWIDKKQERIEKFTTRISK